jgi:hypothetical protein
MEDVVLVGELEMPVAGVGDFRVVRDERLLGGSPPAEEEGARRREREETLGTPQRRPSSRTGTSPERR